MKNLLMDTSIVDTRRGGDNTSCTGLASDAIPEDQRPDKGVDTQIGVSVENVRDPEKKWFVLRATYGRAVKANDIIKKNGVETYSPMYIEATWVKKKKVMRKVSLLPGMLFVYAKEDHVRDIVKDPATSSLLTLYYDHTLTNEYGKNELLTVPEKEMDNFIRLMDTMAEGIKLVDRSQCRFKSGDLVEVTRGQFKGIQGRLARCAGAQRVVVSLTGICLVATAYIPTAYLKVVEDNTPKN